MIVCHIETSAGARFSTHENEEELRQELISYNNDTLNSGEPDEQLPEDATLEEAIEKIEESENVSWEEIWDAPKPQLYLIVHTDDDGYNWDALVEAKDEERAKQLWRKSYWDDEDDDMEPERIFKVTPTGKEGFLSWDSEQLKLVEDNR